MSDFRGALEDRLRKLDSAKGELSDLDSDPFLPPDDSKTLSEAIGLVDTLSNRAKAELELLEADWAQIEDNAAQIIEILEGIAERLHTRNLVDYYNSSYRLEQALDDEPDTLATFREEIGDALDFYYDVLMAAREALDEGGY